MKVAWYQAVWVRPTPQYFKVFFAGIWLVGLMRTMIIFKKETLGILCGILVCVRKPKAVSKATRDAEPSKNLGGRGGSNVVGIICPTGWNRVNWSTKNWGGQLPPPSSYGISDCINITSPVEHSGTIGVRPIHFLTAVLTLFQPGGWSHQISNGSARPV